MDPLLSTRIGEFIVEERIGSGGMGVVYRATHPLIGKQVAIKVLRAELVSPQQVERLLIEARAVNAIRHPGIIDIFGFGDLPDGRPYIIMELLRGDSLSTRIRQQGRLDVGTCLWILDQMLAALGAAHRSGVVHRDLKPGNVFIAEGMDGTHSVKLVDFGIAKLVRSHDGPTTVDGSILGTPEFMAPEQIRGAPVSPSMDLYAVGIIAFQMLTGSRPFNGEPYQVMFAHIEQVPPLPSSRVPGIPPELDTLVLQLLAKQPELRPESAEAVRQALKRVPAPGPHQTRPAPAHPVASAPEEQTRTTRVYPVAAPPPASRRDWRWGVGAVLLAAATGGTLLLWPSQSDGVSESPPAAEPTKPAAIAMPVPERPAAPEEKPQGQETVASGEVVAFEQPLQGEPPTQPEEEASSDRPSEHPAAPPKASRPKPRNKRSPEPEERNQRPEDAQVQTPDEAPAANSNTAAGLTRPQASAPVPTTAPVQPTPQAPSTAAANTTGLAQSSASPLRTPEDLQLDLLAEIDTSAKWLRDNARINVANSDAMARLEILRLSAKNVTAADEYALIRKELAQWKEKLEGRAEATSPVSQEVSLDNLLSAIEKAEAWWITKTHARFKNSTRQHYLNDLRRQAREATTPTQRKNLRDKLDAWQRKNEQQASDAAQ
ncbi:serine/threonine-protein kinase [Pyxidicoccus xibeiensis]|uniref:serine/threonine-protein kinase n=1 Tax=Pyxidicoccus xibeiensis TaxID=2906759 RepID=UPI0020A7AA85|nr:protein kinase [Pyxidicoccus xibeiensis]MCP3137177.1 protein kinase [Pyxidicoccus xibeiensis]